MVKLLPLIVSLVLLLEAALPRCLWDDECGYKMSNGLPQKETPKKNDSPYSAGPLYSIGFFAHIVPYTIGPVFNPGKSYVEHLSFFQPIPFVFTFFQPPIDHFIFRRPPLYTLTSLFNVIF